MGCLLAGRLHEAGEEVILLHRDPREARQIAARGVRIESRDGRRTIPVPVTADPAKAGGTDLLVLTVKAYDTQAAVDQWSNVVGEGSIVLTLQNGIGNVETLLAALPEAPVVGGTTAEGSTRLEMGEIRHAGSGKTVLAAARGGREAAEAAAAPLGRAGFDVHVEDDVEAVIWRKFLTNVGVNALAGVLGLSNGELSRKEEVRDVIRALIAEATEVGRRRGVTLPPNDAARRAQEVLRLTGENVNSLLQDLRKGRRTEIDFLNGKVVVEGKALGVATPVNGALWALVRALESSSG